MSRQPIGNDNDPSKLKPEGSLSLQDDLLMGLRFFSRLPTGSTPHLTPEMARIVPAMGLVSVIIALVPALILVGASLLGLPILISVCLGVGAQVIVTGAMAEDGLADAFDGLWGGHSVEQRLSIMKDSNHGTYGVVALVLFISVRVLAIAALASSSLIGAAMLWIGAQVMARQSSLWLLVTLPPARQDGVAKAAGNLTGAGFAVGAAIASPIVLIFAGKFVGILGLIICAAISMLITLVWSRLCKKLVNGYSGDLIGSLQALVEIGALCTFILFV